MFDADIVSFSFSVLLGKALLATNGTRFAEEAVVGLVASLLEISSDSTAESVVMGPLSLVAEDEKEVFEMLDSVAACWSCLVSISTAGVVDDGVRVRLTEDWPLDEVPSRVTSKAEVELAREATDCVRCVWTKDEDEVREEVVVKISLECCRLLFVPVVVVVVVLLLLPEVGRRSSFFFLLEKSPLIRELMVNEEEVEGVRMWMGL